MTETSSTELRVWSLQFASPNRKSESSNKSRLSHRLGLLGMSGYLSLEGPHEQNLTMLESA